MSSPPEERTPAVGPATALAQEGADTLMPAGTFVTRAEAVAGGPAAFRKGLPVLAWFGLAWLVLLVLAAILAPWLPIPSPTEPFADIARQGPSAGHPFGGDATGFDMLSLLIWGARNSLIVGFGSITLGLLVGIPVGVAGGYFRGKTDAVITFVLDVLLSIPAVIFALALTAFLGKSLGIVTISLAVIAMPTLARIVRANTIVYSQREFVTASRALGASHLRIALREVFPNVIPALVAISLLGVAVAIVAEGALSILNYGLPATEISWGTVIASNRQIFAEAPNSWFFPSLVLFLTVVALNAVGDAVRQRFDVREGAL